MGDFILLHGVQHEQVPNDKRDFSEFPPMSPPSSRITLRISHDAAAQPLLNLDVSSVHRSEVRCDYHSSTCHFQHVFLLKTVCSLDVILIRRRVPLHTKFFRLQMFSLLSGWPSSLGSRLRAFCCSVVHCAELHQGSNTSRSQGLCLPLP